MPHIASPAGAGTPTDKEHLEDSIDAVAAILPHTRGGRNHVVTVRRAPKPKRGREWLASYNFSQEFLIREKQFRNPVRFMRVATHAIDARVTDDAGFVLAIIDLARLNVLWPEVIDGAMALIGGAAS